MTDSFRVRPAVPADAESVTRIYNRFVETCTATWQTVPDTVEKRRSWLVNRRSRHPVYVAENDAGDIVAFAALSPYSDRGAFDDSAEVTLYIVEAAQGRGLGGMLMRTLIDDAKRTGLRVLVSRISGDRNASIALHRKYGFLDGGRIPGMGFKFGRRLDLVHLYLPLIP